MQDYSLGYTVTLEGATTDTPDLQQLTDNKAAKVTAYTYDNLDQLKEAVTNRPPEAPRRLHPNTNTTKPGT